MNASVSVRKREVRRKAPSERNGPGSYGISAFSSRVSLRLNVSSHRIPRYGYTPSRPAVRVALIAGGFIGYSHISHSQPPVLFLYPFGRHPLSSALEGAPALFSGRFFSDPPL